VIGKDKLEAVVGFWQVLEVLSDTQLVEVEEEDSVVVEGLRPMTREGSWILRLMM
jgi:hypothetical protein